MATPICKAIATNTNGAIVFSPEPGHDTPIPIIIHQDDDGEYWYWTPDE